MRRLLSTVSLAAALACLVGAVALADALPSKLASANEADDKPVGPTKAIGRVFFSESGWASPADQHLIIEVYEKRLKEIAPRRVKRLSYAKQLIWIAKRYSTKTFAPDEVRSVPEKRPGRSPRQRWLNDMGPECAEPTGWPLLKRDGTAHPPWRAFESQCQALFERARRFVRKQQPGTCSASLPIDHWGGEMDDPLAEANGWIQVTDWSCVEDGRRFTPQNHAWCDPGLSVCGDGPGSDARDVPEGTRAPRGGVHRFASTAYGG